jgi:hypothetical protein
MCLPLQHLLLTNMLYLHTLLQQVAQGVCKLAEIQARATSQSSKFHSHMHAKAPR